MKIRLFQKEDRDAVVRLWNEVFPNPAPHNDPHKAIDRKIVFGDGLFWVASQNELIIGTLMGGYDGHRGWIYSVAVSTKARRQGVGTALLQTAQRALAGRGCPKINLQVIADNEEVVKFYERQGFVVERRISIGKILP